ncbi:ATP-dependent zinc metalloprotease FtsH [Desulfovibrio sp. OttesenSCG-928-G11]|nr:ATP-dependent zinc metalloprotease FtsH [Desulfovibrio sp. OttesenSCG-928-G11]
MVWALVGLIVLLAVNMFYQQPVRANELTYSEFLDRVNQQHITEVFIQGRKLSGKLADGSPFTSYAPDDSGLVDKLLQKDITIKAGAPDDSPWYIIFLTSWAPTILLVLVWVFFMRQMQGGGGKTMSFGRSRARMITQESARVTFDNVAGVDEAKEELSEVVDFLSNPKKFTRLGGRIPKGVLLVGPPGTGKTLLAKAVAGEAGVPFFSISGSDFVEMFVGVGASRVRDLFAQGKKNAPCLIFIDEIDAVGRQRGAGLGGGHDEREQTLNQLLVEMDGFEANEGVILIAATNRPDVLDPALQRPGRFDRQVVVPPPDIRGRKQILEVHSKRTPLADDVNLDVLARGTPGFSGADLENLVNEAALMAAKENKDFLNMGDFENAKDKLLMGKERRTMVQTPEELKNTAYHEAGHAILNLLLPETDTLHKVTIIPRGRALGVTMYLPEEDKHTLTRVELESKITMAFGGRAAELIIFDKYTTGATNDIQQATKLARSMVCKWGMSELVGPMAVGEQSQEVFVGREWVANKDHSEETSRLVDAEVKRIIDGAMAAAEKLLRENIDSLHRVAGALLERETISGEDVKLLMAGKSLPPLDLKTNPRKMTTTRDYESEGNKDPQNPAEAGAGPGPQNPAAEDGESGPQAERAEDGKRDLASGYDLYGRPGPTAKKAASPLGEALGAGDDDQKAEDAEQNQDQDKNGKA